MILKKSHEVDRFVLRKLPMNPRTPLQTVASDIFVATFLGIKKNFCTGGLSYMYTFHIAVDF
jgi:hypothetical protein